MELARASRCLPGRGASPILPPNVRTLRALHWRDFHEARFQRSEGGQVPQLCRLLTRASLQHNTIPLAFRKHEIEKSQD